MKRGTRADKIRRTCAALRAPLTLVAMILIASVGSVWADIQNDTIGFSPSHVFEQSAEGEVVDVLNGGLTLTIPVGPRYRLGSDFSYGITLYSTNKLWEHDCRDTGALGPECCGKVIVGDTYGAGITLGFGRIHRDARDQTWAYKYRTPDGGDHFFCDTSDSGRDLSQASCSDGYTVDGSRIRVERTATGWEAFPGDGTRVVLEHEVTGGPEAKRGWYATRVDSVASPAVGIDIAYELGSDRIDSIQDSAGRTIEITVEGSQIHVDHPAFPVAGVPGVARYTLVLDSMRLDDPNPDCSQLGPYVQLLTRVTYPGLDATTEDLELCYDRMQCPGGSPDPAGELSWGGVLGRTLPTGATVEYYYGTYKLPTWNRPASMELRFKYLNLDGERYRWSWTRYLAYDLSSPHDPIPLELALGYNFTNPSTVRVLDPFDNLTRYIYDYSWIQSSDCNVAGECTTAATDGALLSVSEYIGPLTDDNRLMRLTEFEWDWDRSAGQVQMFKYRPNALGYPQPTSAYSFPYNPRQVARDVYEPSRAGFPARTARYESSDWVGGIRAKVSRVLDGTALYRTSYTDYELDDVSHDAHRFTERRNATGEVLERTDRYFENGRLLCEVSRIGGSGTTLAGCTAGQLNLQSGDVAMVHTWNASTGTLTSTEVSGGDEGAATTTSFTYQAGGNLATKNLGFSWNAVDRTIDAGTGLVASSRDPSGTQITYEWDALGRLTKIAPPAPEASTTISYPSVLETRVRQEVSASNFIETVYLYDTLGRLIETKKRNIDGTYDSQKTEYDVLGRVVRVSEWVAEGTPDEERPWTTNDYTALVDPEPPPGRPTHYPDPYGRVQRVVRPDDPTPETPTIEYEYGARETRVRVRDIRGPETSGANPLTAETVFVNDAYGRLVHVDSPGSGADADYRYSELDRLEEVRLTDPASPSVVQRRVFGYDALGRLRSATNPENGTVTYESYDARGNLLRWKDATGVKFVSTFDAAGRLVDKRQGIGGPLLVENVYDASGAAGKLSLQKSYEVGSGVSTLVATESFTYGPANGAPSCAIGSRGWAGLNGRLASRTTTLSPWNAAVKTEYCQDELGLPYMIGYPDTVASGRTRSRVGHSFQNGYLWELHDFGRAIQYLKNIEYGASGQATEIVRGNNVSDTILRDLMGRPERFQAIAPVAPSPRPPLSAVGGCGGPFGSRPQEIQGCPHGDPGGVATLWDSGAYAFDMAGNVTQIGGSAYFYDELSRLVEAEVTTQTGGEVHSVGLSYDGFGNILSHGRSSSIPGGWWEQHDFVVDPQTNRLTFQTYQDAFTVEPRNYVYSPTGNLTVEGNTTFSWDAQNRLQQVTDPEDGTLGSYDYDANGYRIRSLVDGVETFYVRDGTGRVLTEFQRQAGSTAAPVWNKDYIYALGQAVALVKNDIPAAPGRPETSDVTSTSLTLTWDPVEEVDLAGYQILRTYDVDTTVPPDGVLLPVVNVGATTSYVVNYPTAGPNARVDIEIRAVDSAANTGPESPVVRVRPAGPPPPTPIGLTGIPGDSLVRLTWNAIDESSTPADDDIRGYDVEQRSGSGMNTVWTRLNGAPLELPEYEVAPLINGTAYHFRVLAVDTSGRRSVPTETVSVVPLDSIPPGPPSNLTAEADRVAETIRVRWRGVADPDASAYIVYRNIENNSITATAFGTVPDGTSEWFELVDNAATSGQTFWYWVSTRDTSGNESSRIGPASARPRHSGVEAPVLTGAVYEVDPGPPISTDPFAECSAEHEVDGLEGTSHRDHGCTAMQDNDVIQVRVTWNPSTGAEAYSVYRQSPAESSWERVASGLDPGTTVYLDTNAPLGEYRYFVVATQMLSAVEEESAASSNLGGAIDLDLAVDDFPSDTFVQNLTVWDGRQEFSTANKFSRMTYVEWSRVPESKLVGYHVYRKCRYDEWCQLEKAPLHPACDPSWQRVTDAPIPPEAQQWIADHSVGGMGGCYMYAVRPVGPDGIEGPVNKIVRAWLGESQGSWGASSTAEEWDWDPLQADVVSGVQVYQWELQRDLINGGVRGVGAPTGPPPPPGGVVAEWKRRQTDSGSRLLRNLVVSWTSPSPASDLAGYHIEVAGSYQGPWKRVTRNPLAWWETTYVVPAMSLQRPDYQGGWYPPSLDCAQVRVVAVDEAGNESAPAEALITPPPSSCFATPGAPLNLRASTESPPSPGCTIRLEWDPPAAGSEAVVTYRVYRYKMGSSPYIHFYPTHEQPEADPRVFIETGLDENENMETQAETYCPYSQSPSSGNCFNDRLTAFYVTAIGASRGESPRSNIVFWDCHSDPGYARWSPMSEDVFEAIAANPGPGVNEVVASILEGLSPRRLPRPDLSIAPPFGLGQTTNPPWKVFDLHVDHLGSTRLVTDNSGAVTSRHDYLPFGQEISQGISYNTHAFTGHERDKATGLDYMLARYYGANLARFVSADLSRLDVDRRNVSSWNGYMYVRNNPLAFVDGNGLYTKSAHQGWTYYAARQAGYSESESRSIAKANRNSDVGLSSAWLGKSNRRNRHGFCHGTCRNEAAEAVANTDPNDLKALGEGLHHYQDTFSHDKFGPGGGHLRAGKKPDYTSTDPGKATEMVAGSYTLLSGAAGASGRQGFGAPDAGFIQSVASVDGEITEYDPETNTSTIEVEEGKAEELAEELSAQGYTVTIDGKPYEPKSK